MRGFGSLLVLAPVLVAAGCVDFFLEPEPGRDPATLFDAFWGEFDAYYASFERKGIDWDSVYAAYRPLIRQDMSNVELAGVMAQMMLVLEDGHADLFTTVGHYGYTGWYDAYLANFDASALPRYVRTAPPGQSGNAGLIQGLGLAFGWVTAGIGYLRIDNFGNPAIRDGIDDALQALAGVDALVIDIRHNGGGSDLNTDAVAGRLTDRRYLYRHYRYRNGPEHDDFTRVFDDYIEPVGQERFLGPVAVLTNRRTFSAAEAFIMAMQARGGAFTVGDTTGGGTGNPIWRELPNAWTFRVPRWIDWSAAGDTVDGVGIPPDVPVQIPPAVEGTGVDPILERAIAELDALPGVI